MAQKGKYSIRLMLDTLTVCVLLLLHHVITKQVVSVVVVEGEAHAHACLMTGLQIAL